MADLDPPDVTLVDVCGTTVDWWPGARRQLRQITADVGVERDTAAFVDAWLDLPVPFMAVSGTVNGPGRTSTPCTASRSTSCSPDSGSPRRSTSRHDPRRREEHR